MTRYLRFAARVLRDFGRNRGLLLASGVGYNVLLSMIPMLAVIAAVMSGIVDRERLVDIIANQARLIVPGQATYIADTVASMVSNRHVVGGVGLAVSLFFSSLAFRMLDDAMAIIFHRHARSDRRNLLVTFLLPYAYALALGIALLVLTGAFVVLDGLTRLDYVMMGIHLPLSAAAVFGLWAVGFLGVALLFASIYKVIPVVHIDSKRALAGGLVAAALWEITRRALGWWFANLSLVDAVYGSLGTVVVVLLYLEVVAVIVLLGGQVIAELERSASAGVAWHEDPDDPPEKGDSGDSR